MLPLPTSSPLFRLFLLAAVVVISSCEYTVTERYYGGQISADSIIICRTKGKENALINVRLPDDEPLLNLEVFLSTGKMPLGIAMGKLTELDIEMKEYPGMGRLLTGINGVRNDDQGNRYWQFCLNGVVADKGIDDIYIRDGDRVDWHFVAFNELPCKKIGE